MILRGLFVALTLLLITGIWSTALASPVGWSPPHNLEIEIGPGELPAVPAYANFQHLTDFEVAIGLLEVSFLDADGESVAGELEIRKLITRFMANRPQGSFTSYSAIFIWHPDEALEVGEQYSMEFQQGDWSHESVVVHTIEEDGASPESVLVQEPSLEASILFWEFQCCGCGGMEANPSNCDECSVVDAQHYGIISADAEIDVEGSNLDQWIVHALDDEGESVRSVGLREFNRWEQSGMERVIWEMPDEPCIVVALEGLHDESWIFSEPACVEIPEEFSFDSFSSETPVVCEDGDDVGIGADAGPEGDVGNGAASENEAGSGCSLAGQGPSPLGLALIFLLGFVIRRNSGAIGMSG